MKLQQITEVRLAIICAAYELEAHKRRVTVAEAMMAAGIPFGNEMLGRRFEFTHEELALVQELQEIRFVN